MTERMTIIKASDIKERPIRMHIYGEPGSGKTTLLATAPKPVLVIDFEAGSDIRLKGEDDIYICQIRSRKDIEEVIKHIQNSKSYKTIAFDGFSVFTQKVLNEILQERQKTTPTYYEWGILTKTLHQIILNLMYPNSHLIFTSLSKRITLLIDENNNKIERIIPDLTRAVRDILKAVMDFQAYLYVEEKDKRYLFFKSEKGIIEVKDRSGKLSKEEPNISKIISKVFGGEK